MSTRGIPFVVAAPSGTGKTTVCRELVRRDPLLVFSISHTTREPRSNEQPDVNYHFVKPADFERMIDNGNFLEWAVYNGNHYGTSWDAIHAPLAEGRDVLLEIEVQGARQVRKKRPDARLLFLMPPSRAALIERLTLRGTDSHEEVAARLHTAERELAAVQEFDYAVVNDELERCIAHVGEIIAAEREGRAAELRRKFAPAVAAERLRAASP